MNCERAATIAAKYLSRLVFVRTSSEPLHDRERDVAGTAEISDVLIVSGEMNTIRRVVVVVLDGLRPDAIDVFGLRHIAQARATGAYSMSAQTVLPSVTACALTSLFSGASPEWHGMRSDKFKIPKSRGPLHPMPKMLAQHGFPSAVHRDQIPFLFRGFARQVARILGLTATGFHNDGSVGIVAGARTTIATQRCGLILTHWLDADRAGHAHGWMSPEYGAAARRMDGAFDELVSRIHTSGRDDTLLIALADHGGGGAKHDDHDSQHPLDTTIPIILSGAAVLAGPLAGPVSLLDVPATVLWALGVPRPSTYAGRAIVEAFTEALAAA